MNRNLFKKPVVTITKNSCMSLPNLEIFFFPITPKVPNFLVRACWTQALDKKNERFVQSVGTNIFYLQNMDFNVSKKYLILIFKELTSSLILPMSRKHWLIPIL